MSRDPGTSDGRRQGWAWADCCSYATAVSWWELTSLRVYKDVLMLQSPGAIVSARADTDSHGGAWLAS